MLSLFFVAATAWAIPPEEAAKHVGETVTVEGTVFNVNVSRVGNVFLNFGGACPAQIFSAMVSSRTLNPRDYVDYTGKSVKVSGKVLLNRGKPEIVITSTSQIVMVQ